MQKIVDPALLGESVRAGVEYLQQTGEYEKLLKEALADKGMSIREQRLIQYAELLFELGGMNASNG